MSMFSKMMDRIFQGPEAPPPPKVENPLRPGGRAETAPQPAQAAPAAKVPVAGQPATATPMVPVLDVEASLDKMAATHAEKLDWRHSIVDLMKLVGMDSSLTARKELAHDLNYTGDINDSAKMNVWLHKEVMRKLAEHGGKVPAELLSH